MTMTPTGFLVRLSLGGVAFFLTMGAIVGTASGVGALQGALAAVGGGAFGVAIGAVLHSRMTPRKGTMK